MALQTQTFKNNLKSLLDELYSNPNNLTTEQARQKWANDFGDYMEAYIKTGKVQTGIALTSTGNASSHTGLTTSLGNII